MKKISQLDKLEVYEWASKRQFFEFEATSTELKFDEYAKNFFDQLPPNTPFPLSSLFLQSPLQILIRHHLGLNEMDLIDYIRVAVTAFAGEMLYSRINRSDTWLVRAIFPPQTK